MLHRFRPYQVTRTVYEEPITHANIFPTLHDHFWVDCSAFRLDNVLESGVNLIFANDSGDWAVLEVLQEGEAHDGSGPVLQVRAIESYTVAWMSEDTFWAELHETLAHANDGHPAPFLLATHPVSEQCGLCR